ncbi:MAG: hypothetical protein AAF694_15780 [Bacteroidota bacterium]
MSLEEIYELTDAFLAGELSQEDTLAFEDRCKSDPEFGKEVQLYIASLREIRLEGEQALKSQLMDRFSEAKVIPMEASSNRAPWFAAAAAAVALLVISIWWFTSSPQQVEPPKDLYAQYMKIPDISVTRAPMEGTYASQWGQTLGLLKDSMFQEAIPMLDTLLQDTTFFASYGGQGIMYLGTSLMHMGKYEEALTQFQRIESENPYSDQILWYEALSYVKLEDIPEATRTLKAIVEKPIHYKRKEAQAILDQYSPN